MYSAQFKPQQLVVQPVQPAQQQIDLSPLLNQLPSILTLVMVFALIVPMFREMSESFGGR